jgi:hypothetical protein
MEFVDVNQTCGELITSITQCFLGTGSWEASCLTDIIACQIREETPN